MLGLLFVMGGAALNCTKCRFLVKHRLDDAQTRPLVMGGAAPPRAAEPPRAGAEGRGRRAGGNNFYAWDTTLRMVGTHPPC
eukprot:SAG11_NODE_18868_length_479_cov_1.465789_2_plen_80_part_01